MSADTRRARDEYAKSLFNVAVGRAVREIRLRENLSQRELGDYAGISQTLLGNIEAGAAALPLFAASGIAEACDCTLDDLVPVMLDDQEES